MPKITDIGRWRSELIIAEGIRDDDFGKYNINEITKAGENVEYFERGFNFGFYEVNDDSTTTLNLFHAISKNIVPALLFQNPRVLTFPKRKKDEDIAPIAREILNYYYKELDINHINKKVVWDAYVLGKGYYKTGYATKFGKDVIDEKKQKEKRKNLSNVDGILENLGLRKTKEKEKVIHPEVDQTIVAESPYIEYVSPFKFLKDPRALNLQSAFWVAQEFDKTVEELKSNKMYKNTEELKGTEPDLRRRNALKVPQSELDAFKTVRLYEVHYRQPDGMYLLIITKDGGDFREHYHDKLIYEMDEWLFDELSFNDHGHGYYNRSDLTKIKSLQDRLTNTFDSILEQVDRFVPKLMIDENAVTDEGKRNAVNGDIGSIVWTNKNPGEAARELSITQLKVDLKALIDEIINVVTIQTGLTKAKLLGVSQAETATGETISQGGETLRLAEMGQAVQRLLNRQARKLWQVIRQFVDMSQLELITGERGINPETGLPIYRWLPEIDLSISERLAKGEFRFDIEVGSTEKADSALITKRIENLISILGRTDIIALMQQQGKKVDVAEILRLWLQNNPEIVKDTGRIIQDVDDQTQGLLPAQDILVGGQGGQTDGSNVNEARRLEAQGPVTSQDVLQEASQI